MVFLIEQPERTETHPGTEQVFVLYPETPSLESPVGKGIWGAWSTFAQWRRRGSVWVPSQS